MAATGLAVFDTTLQKTHAWLKEVMQELGTDDRHSAYLALRAVLHALRDRLTIEETAQLGAQLPMLIRGFYYEGWDPSGKPVKARRKEDFLRHINRYFKHTRFGESGTDPERIAQAVFRVLARRVSEGEIEDIVRILPRELRELWPEVQAV